MPLLPPSREAWDTLLFYWQFFPLVLHLPSSPQGPSPPSLTPFPYPPSSAPPGAPLHPPSASLTPFSKPVRAGAVRNAVVSDGEDERGVAAERGRQVGVGGDGDARVRGAAVRDGDAAGGAGDRGWVAVGELGHGGVVSKIWKWTIHYLYRALLAPLVLNPSMSPIHPTIFLAALSFQLCNAICLGGWLAGYGPVTAADWRDRKLAVITGTIIFALGLVGNIYHDDVLREIRRAAARKMQLREDLNEEDHYDDDNADQEGKGQTKKRRSVAKVYLVPETGLFRWVLYPHYLCEWIEWSGFWLIGGWACVPGRCFVVNEVASMLPRAVIGKRWYVQRFGKEKVGSRKAVVPWTI